MKMTMKNLSLAVVSAIALMTVNSSFAAPLVDNKGDSLIQAPADNSTVTTDSVDIWFRYKENAMGYTLDLRGDSTGTGNECNGTVDDIPNATTTLTYHKTLYLPASGLDCGQETTDTIAGDDTTGTNGYHLCKYTTGILANGDYAVAINPVAKGTGKYSVTEKAGHCGDDVSNIGGNNLVDMSTVAISTNKNYQTFTVAVPTTGGVGVTQAPNTPEPYLPAAGTTVYGVTYASSSVNGAPDINKLIFTDSSPANGKAKWYELWVYDKNNTRITDFANDNPTYTNWYKLTVDPSLDCQANGNAAGDRVCSIDISAKAEIMSAAATDTFKWWVKGWNSIGASGWSTAPGTFVK